MRNVNEELRPARLRLACVGHGEGAHIVGDTLVRLTNLIRNAAVVGAYVRSTITPTESRSGPRPTSPCSRRVGILGVWTTKLVHEVRYDPVEVNAIVKARISQVNEIAARDGHLARVELGTEGTLGRLERSDGHGGWLRTQGT